jgi:hypothetical protein
MGQQQLILLVLATVIVGIAIVVGITAFTENSAKSNADTMMQDAVRIANDMQAWKKKPAPFGGQASVAACDAACLAADNNFTGVTFARLGYASPTTLNGTYAITSEAANPLITGTNTVEGNEVQVRVCGMRAGDVQGAIVDLGGVADIGALPAACP